MADLGLRRLERAAQSSESPQLWAAYITAAVRAGELDPLNWSAAVSYLSKVPLPVRPDHQLIIEEGFSDNYQQLMEQYQEAQEAFYLREQQIIDTLHQIRLINGHWSAQQIADHINAVLPHLFKADYRATVETAEYRRRLESGEVTEGVLVPAYLEGPEEVDTDVVAIPSMETFISFDEKLLVPARRDRGEPQPAVPRPINDFITQVYVVSRYTYWTEAHGEQMSEVVEAARYNNPHQLMLALIEMIQSDIRDALGDIHYERELEEEDRLWEEGGF